jgi:formylglycine-generating enzyme required for sulfatase activity
MSIDLLSVAPTDCLSSSASKQLHVTCVCHPDLLTAAKDPRGEIVRSLDRLVAWGADMPDERPQIEKRLCELLESGVSAIGPFVTNSIAMKLALIVPGEFVMGSPDNEFGHREDEAQDVVKISRPFLLGVTAVTQGQYQELMNENPSWGHDPNKNEPMELSSRFRPVDQVTWSDAVEFCHRLSELPDERAEGRVYELPTEAEWEFACRAGTTGPFHFGQTLPTHLANFNGNKPYVFAKRGDFLGRSVAVGMHFPNAFGLQDMHGNVWEWCLSKCYQRCFSIEPINHPTSRWCCGRAN